MMNLSKTKTLATSWPDSRYIPSDYRIAQKNPIWAVQTYASVASNGLFAWGETQPTAPRWYTDTSTHPYTP